MGAMLLGLFLGLAGTELIAKKPSVASAA